MVRHDPNIIPIEILWIKEFYLQDNKKYNMYYIVYKKNNDNNNIYGSIISSTVEKEDAIAAVAAVAAVAKNDKIDVINNKNVKFTYQDIPK